MHVGGKCQQFLINKQCPVSDLRIKNHQYVDLSILGWHPATERCYAILQSSKCSAYFAALRQYMRKLNAENHALFETNYKGSLCDIYWFRNRYVIFTFAFHFMTLKPHVLWICYCLVGAEAIAYYILCMVDKLFSVHIIYL